MSPDMTPFRNNVLEVKKNDINDFELMTIQTNQKSSKIFSVVMTTHFLQS